MNLECASFKSESFFHRRAIYYFMRFVQLRKSDRVGHRKLRRFCRTNLEGHKKILYLSVYKLNLLPGRLSAKAVEKTKNLSG
jgi:hypothetical protein